MALINNETKTFTVTSVCPQYTKQLSRWKVCRDTIEGEDVVKDMGEAYLPMASGKDCEGRKKRYEAFKMRTPYVNFVGGAHGIMHAMIFRRTPTIRCEDSFKQSGRLEDVDGTGKSIYQFTSDSVFDLLITGFGAWLLDIPPAEPGMTKYDAEKKGIRPYLTYYPAESVINWCYDNSSGQKKLKYVVLKENVDVYTDEFIVKNQERYRVLRINEDGFYEQRIYTPIYENGQIKDMTIVTNPVTVDNKPIVLLPFETP